MSTICGHCRLPIANGETGVRHFGHYVAHTENRCVSLLSAEIERLRARVASLEESLHYANGTADLAMKHRDDAEKRVSELEQDAAMRGFLLDLRSDLREPAEREGGLFHYFYQRVSEQLGLSALAKDGA